MLLLLVQFEQGNRHQSLFTLSKVTHFILWSQTGNCIMYILHSKVGGISRNHFQFQHCVSFLLNCMLMYSMCVLSCFFSALSHRVGTLQISIIIITINSIIKKRNEVE